MRLAQLLPCSVLLLSLIPACGDDDPKNPPDEPAGAGGEAGSGPAQGGDQAMAGKPPTDQGGAGGEGPDEGDGGMSSMGGSPEAGAPPEVDCSKVVAAPADFEEIFGFAKSEDFAFDALGNYVGVDDSANLVRITIKGNKELWAPSIGGTAGMAMLPDGSVIIADVDNGALKRVYPSGGSEVVIGGLLYPNGVDIGPDGFIYVAENNAGRVRRVDPDTGKFTIAAMGLYGANGVAFSNDPKLMYVGSFPNSGIYKVEIPAPGQVGTSSVFARPNGSQLPEPKLACPDQVVGKSCVMTTEGDQPGKCRQLSNVVDCVPSGPCDDLPEGSECVSDQGPGTCVSGLCIWKDPCEEEPTGPTCCVGEGCCNGKDCPPSDPCKGLNAGDACTSPWFGAGECVDSGGQLYCEPPNPCKGLNAGDTCTTTWGAGGQCVDYGEGNLGCEQLPPCQGLNAGDACKDWFGAGICVDDEGDLVCEQPNACAGKPDGEACTLSGSDEVGECYQEYCQQLPCAGSQPGDLCSRKGFMGVCEGPAEGPLECVNKCEGKPDGEACTLWGDPAGECHNGNCAAVPCKGAKPGAVCLDFEGSPGACEGPAEGPLECINRCKGAEDGAACKINGYDGTCSDQACYVTCTQESVGQQCMTKEGPGYCEQTENGVECVLGNSSQPGGIDGMGVDACGNVYASEYTNGNLWRVSPAGKVELLAKLPSGWVPNIKWGRGIGGFEKDIMYVADRDKGRLFAVTVGVEGATEYYDIGEAE